MSNVVEKYRQAAIDLYGISREEAEESIVAPEDDNGEWAPNSLAVIYFDRGNTMTASCGYHAINGFDECIRLSRKAGTGFIEYINAAVGAVYE